MDRNSSCCKQLLYRLSLHIKLKYPVWKRSCAVPSAVYSSDSPDNLYDYLFLHLKYISLLTYFEQPIRSNKSPHSDLNICMRNFEIILNIYLHLEVLEFQWTYAISTLILPVPRIDILLTYYKKGACELEHLFVKIKVAEKGWMKWEGGRCDTLRPGSTVPQLWTKHSIHWAADTSLVSSCAVSNTGAYGWCLGSYMKW